MINRIYNLLDYFESKTGRSADTIIIDVDSFILLEKEVESIFHLIPNTSGKKGYWFRGRRILRVLKDDSKEIVEVTRLEL